MTPRRTSLAVLCAAFLCAAVPFAAAAQSKADAFAGKIPPVSGQLYRKAGRAEVTVTGNLSLNDAFFNKYFGGVKLGYHLSERLSGAVHAAGGASMKTSSAVRCSAAGACTDATETMLRQVPGRIRWLVGAEAAWSPVYGKLNVVSEQVAHFDVSVLAGPDLIAYDEVLFKEDATQTPGTATSIGGHVGLGARLFLTESIAVRFEMKDYVYSATVPRNAAVKSLGTTSDLQNQLFAEIGISVFLPLRNRSLR